MSITVRLYSKNELESIKDACKEFKTVFANKKTFSGEEWKSYTKIQAEIKTFFVWFYDESEPVEIKAIDDESLKWFLRQEYKNLDNVSDICEKIVTWRDVVIGEN